MGKQKKFFFLFLKKILKKKKKKKKKSMIVIKFKKYIYIKEYWKKFLLVKNINKRL